MVFRHLTVVSFFFFNATATTEIYTLSLHDALPICIRERFLPDGSQVRSDFQGSRSLTSTVTGDRKSTRLNSSHSQISYAVFCLKKKNRTFFGAVGVIERRA